MTKNTGILFDSGFDLEILLKQGHLWVAPIWNHVAAKFTPRPIVIVGNEDANDKIGLIINFVTKQDPRDKFDVPIEFWEVAGLNCPSWVRTAKPTTIEGVIRPRGYIGKLHDHDLEKIIAMCKNIF
jgi:mRNA interferase MazF